ncbi:hypothetical protein ACLKA6_012391 [Drosophila palustris]
MKRKRRAQSEDKEKTDAKARKRVIQKPHILYEYRSRGRFESAFENLTKTPKKFFDNFHMTTANFNHLFSLVEPFLIPNRNLRPDAIPLKAKLATVIEMLASGLFQQDVAASYGISKQHMGKTVDLVCDAICSALSGVFPRWTKQNMLKWAEEFETQCDLPNCIGAIDGKHVPIKDPPNSDNAFYNYKEFHSIVLLAVCDASYRFTYIDVGAYGSDGDINAFCNTKLGEAILSERLEFPENRLLNDVPTPYFMAGSEAFPLYTRLMTPYGAETPLTTTERIFNHRLSRARRCTEYTFGILCARWMAVQRTVLWNPDRAQKIVSACCSLHNFMMQSSSADLYFPQEVETDTTLEDLLPYSNPNEEEEEEPKCIRNNLLEYVNSASGSISGQYEAATDQTVDQ